MLLVMIDREPEEARDVEPAVRRVRPEPCPTDIIERPDRGDRPGPPPCEHGQDLEERGILEPRGETRLGPRPVRIVLLGESCQARPPHLVLDGDEVAYGLIRTPLAVRDRPPLRGACLGCAGEPAGERGERRDQGGALVRGSGPGHQASVSISLRRHASVASTALNVYRCRPVTRADASAISGARSSTSRVGL